MMDTINMLQSSPLTPLTNLTNQTSTMITSTNSNIKMTTLSNMSNSNFDPLGSLWPKEMDEFSNLAFQACHQEVKRVSENLGISQDPFTWTIDDVLSWLSWQVKQFGLPTFPLQYFQIDGMTLCSLSENDFKSRALYCGDVLYAQLEIWKTLSEQGCKNSIDTIVTSDYGSEGTQSDVDELSQDGTCEVSSPTSTCPGNSPTSGRTTGSHIHLWQFLKELLGQPQQFGSCIRWLDRTKGIFKIEDSVRVAKLWGRRKNRPAMNYDKLSRSIRQYYKKGIMKKTERSQRLVYQFCQPYCF
ncbi:DNA-binding protein D-ETS-4-like isoform X2 [Brevipalpus obovatus]|uniref:DNA-binding protein D-ETS-4-like isoform X2 n=1 Tax=Brevipalpus obovatus TaxID=246614 RepID=UPI003D9F69D1